MHTYTVPTNHDSQTCLGSYQGTSIVIPRRTTAERGEHTKESSSVRIIPCHTQKPTPCIDTMRAPSALAMRRGLNTPCTSTYYLQHGFWGSYPPACDYVHEVDGVDDLDGVHDVEGGYFIIVPEASRGRRSLSIL